MAQDAPAAMAVWREIATALGVGARIDQGRVPPGLHATRSAVLQAGKHPTGAVGEIDPAVLRRFEVTERVAVLDPYAGAAFDEVPVTITR